MAWVLCSLPWLCALKLESTSVKTIQDNDLKHLISKFTSEYIKKRRRRFYTEQVKVWTFLLTLIRLFMAKLQQFHKDEKKTTM